ncbi:MAG: hypothetical protein JOZ14_11010 [Acidobacteria bacterium]|nr:hypothetical protein [Acidobacteriota bacterium]
MRSKVQIAIVAGSACLVVAGFLIYLAWLNNQPPVLAKSPEVDPLTRVPVSMRLNPLRDRSSERVAAAFLLAMRDGRCGEELADWEKDYRKRRALFICDSERTHPLQAWRIVDWEDRPPLRILYYEGKRRNQDLSYEELLSVTLDDRSGQWLVTKYDSLY